MEKKDIRQKLLRVRKTLSKSQRKHSAEQILKALRNFSPFIKSRHVALYMAAAGEVMTQGIVKYLWENNQRSYLPVINAGKEKSLLFAPWHGKTTMVKNIYGIEEPLYCPEFLRKPYQLDIVLAPLVAFDRKLFRLGMGGGFYDRAFSDRKHGSIAPLLVGLAYEFQYIPEYLPVDPWDVPMDVIFTETKIIHRS